MVIESDRVPIGVLRPVGEDFRPRLLSESIALAKKYVEELGYEPTLDPAFAADLEENHNWSAFAQINLPGMEDNPDYRVHR